jgi:hypothetical protein
MGPSGKLGTILQAFGAPVMKQGSNLMDVGYLESPYQDEVYTEYSSTLSGQQGPIAHRDEILDLEDDGVHNQGLLFDGLSRGIHMEILYWHDTNEIKVSYRGFQVYHEIAGELSAYAPFPEWEDLIEKLHRAAKERMKKIKKDRELEFAEQIQTEKKAFWQKLRTRWGL